MKQLCARRPLAACRAQWILSVWEPRLGRGLTWHTGNMRVLFVSDVIDRRLAVLLQREDGSPTCVFSFMAWPSGGRLSDPFTPLATALVFRSLWGVMYTLLGNLLYNGTCGSPAKWNTFETPTWTPVSWHHVMDGQCLTVLPCLILPLGVSWNMVPCQVFAHCSRLIMALLI